METKRLIPYSVHLREDIYNQLKDAAKGRKASGIVRDAITMIIEGDDAFNAGFNKGLREAIKVVREDVWAKSLSVHGELLSEVLADQISEKIGGENGNTQKA
jgi:hypothetical protein